MSTTKSVLPDNATVEQVFKALETETAALFEHLDFSFLVDYSVFAPDPRERTRVHQPPELLKGLLHRFYHDIYGPRPMARALHNEDVWRQCGFTRPPGRRTLERCITDFALVAEDVFITLVHGLAEQVPLGKLYRIDGTDISVDQQDDEAEWNYDHAEDDFYYGYGCYLVTFADNIPVAATFTPAKKVDQETAIGVCKNLGLGTHGSEAESESNPTSSWRCVFGSRLHSQITNGIMTSLVQSSPYENHSAPPPYRLVEKLNTSQPQGGTYCMPKLSPSRIVRIYLIVGFVSISVGVLWAHFEGSSWPGVHISMMAALALIALFINSDYEFHPLLLLFPIGMGVYYRLHIFMFPASMIAFDPDFYALQVRNIIESGTIDVIQVGYYSAAPLFQVLGASSGIITNIPATKILSIYPILIGIIFPLGAFTLIRYCISVPRFGSWAGFAGSIIAAVVAVSVSLSYQPIAETLAATQWIILCIVIVIYFRNQSTGIFFLFLIISVSIVFTHKLPPTALALSLLSLSIIFLFSSKINIIKNIQKAKQKSSILLLISGCLVLLQYFYFTTLGQNLVFRLFSFFNPEYQSALYSGSFSARRAVPIGVSLLETSIRNLHMVIVPLAAASWLILMVRVIRDRSFQLGIPVVLAFSASTGFMMLVTLIGPSIGGSIGRTLLIAEPILIAVIILATHDKINVTKAVVILLIGSQLFSGISIAPGYQEGGEIYLTEQELSGKEFGWEYVSDHIYTDPYYSSERIPSRINEKNSLYDDNEPHYLSLNDTRFLNGTINWNQTYILLRNRTKFRTSYGWYQLSWTPAGEAEKKYSEVYENGDVSLYTALSG